MATPTTLTLREAVTSSLRMGGLELLGQPQRFTSYLLDLADNNSREVRLLSRQLDSDLLAPLVQATKRDCTTATLLTARSHIEQILVNDRFVSDELARSVADDLAGGIADFMGARLSFDEEDAALPHLEPKPVQSAPPQPKPEPKPEPKPQPKPQHQQTQPQSRPKSPAPASTNKGKKGNIARIIILLVAVIAIGWALWYNLSMPSASEIEASANYVSGSSAIQASLYNPTDKNCVATFIISVEDHNGDKHTVEAYENIPLLAGETISRTVPTSYNRLYTPVIDYNLVPYNPLIPG